MQVGVPLTLAQIGLQELSRELLEEIALRATQSGESIHNEPFEVSSGRVADAILATDELGRSWLNKRNAKFAKLDLRP